MMSDTAAGVALFPTEQPGPGADGEWRRTVDRFVRAQRQDLLGFLRKRTATEDAAEDAAQESFLRLLHYVRTEPSENWKALLYRIAANVAIDQGRRIQRRHQAQHVPIEDMEIDSGEPRQEERLAHEQEVARLRAAILALPPKCRQVYLLRLEGRSYNAIASHCGISLKMVEKHIGKALATLRRDAGFSSGGTFR